MLSALVEDFSQIVGLKVVVLRSQPADNERRFRALARASDYTLVIAPEFDDILHSRCKWVLEEGGRLLGPTPEAVQLCADKLALAEQLAQWWIPTPTTFPATSVNRPGTWVWKPRYGAGSIATFTLRDECDWAHCKQRAEAEGWHGENIVQPFVAGHSASVAFLLGPCTRMALTPCTQVLSSDGRFRYLGGAVPLGEPFATRAVSLATRAVDSVPGLEGYVGVDLVLGDANDASDDWIIEINPRITTSYVGLRKLSTSNLADAILRTIQGEFLSPIRWKNTQFQFFQDGRTETV